MASRARRAGSDGDGGAVARRPAPRPRRPASPARIWCPARRTHRGWDLERAAGLPSRRRLRGRPRGVDRPVRARPRAGPRAGRPWLSSDVLPGRRLPGAAVQAAARRACRERHLCGYIRLRRGACLPSAATTSVSPSPSTSRTSRARTIRSSSRQATRPGWSRFLCYPTFAGSAGCSTAMRGRRSAQRFLQSRHTRAPRPLQPAGATGLARPDRRALVGSVGAGLRTLSSPQPADPPSRGAPLGGAPDGCGVRA